MSIRSLTVIYDDGKKLVTMYRQEDGFPSEHGTELADFLLSRTLVDGTGLEDTKKIANGMDCLAALMVSHFKGDSAGDIYLMPHNNNYNQEYEYHVHEDRIIVKSAGYRKKVIFSGSWLDFKVFCENES